MWTKENRFILGTLRVQNDSGEWKFEDARQPGECNFFLMCTPALSCSPVNLFWKNEIFHICVCCSLNMWSKLPFCVKQPYSTPPIHIFRVINPQLRYGNYKTNYRWSVSNRMKIFNLAFDIKVLFENSHGIFFQFPWSLVNFTTYW